jgi:branched-chain amino acid transport system substrate-binding protein
MKSKTLICLALLFFLPTFAEAEEAIKIGVLAPLDISVGKGLKNGIEMAAEEINASGGILGKKIELVVADTKLKPVIGAYEYTRLASQEKVAAVLGTFSSEEALAVLEQVPKYKVPFLTGSAMPEITEKVKQNYGSLKYVFRVYFNSYELADFSSEWLISDLIGKRGFKRFAFMLENANWARPIAAKWEKDLKDAGATIPVIEYFDKETKDFKPIFTKITEAGCETICVLTSITDASAFLTQWMESKGPLMAGIIGSFRTAWNTSGSKAVSLITTSSQGIFYVKGKGMAFRDKYFERYKIAPEYTSLYFYDAMYMLKSAIERSKSVEADAIVDAMEKTDYTGIMGRWVFDKASHHSRFGPGFRQFMMTQWQPDEKVCVIYPDENKTCEMIFPQWK